MESALIKRFGISPDRLRRYEHPAATLAHYSKRTVDLQYQYPWGWDELWGIANRRDYDLALHEKASGKSFAVRDPETNESFRPYVIEPTGGIDRLLLAILCESYTVIKGGRTTTTESIKDEEVMLKLPPRLAPYQVAVLPLSKKPQLQEIGQKLALALRKHWSVAYDETGSIGKRYRRQDEIGTPYCITVDFDTLEGGKRPRGTVTIRDRDSMQQENVAFDELTPYFEAKLE
jgi:glycyl-tRNA synthetase